MKFMSTKHSKSKDFKLSFDFLLDFFNVTSQNYSQLKNVEFLAKIRCSANLREKWTIVSTASIISTRVVFCMDFTKVDEQGGVDV